MHYKNQRPHLQTFPCEERKVAQGFTLVELVVVATILAILGAIGFSSYTNYISGSRDTNRIVQTQDIYDGISLYQTKSNLLLPDDSVEIRIGGTVSSYQGDAGANVLESIGYKEGGKDPKTGEYFTYAIDGDKNIFQISAFLEEENTQNTAFVSSTSAIDYSENFIVTTGSKLGIFTDDTKTPVQNIDQIISDGYLDITSGSTGYIAHLSGEETLTGTGLIQAYPKQSCKRIKDLKKSSKDGSYKINPDANGEFSVFCDMTTDGGGWTAIEYSADLPFQSQFSSADQRRWLDSNFSLKLSDAQINAIRAISTEGKQRYVSTCNGVVTYMYSGGYTYAFGFRMQTNEETPYGVDYSTVTEYDITVPVDVCESNGGEGGALNKATVFEIQDLRVPVINVNTLDNGPGEAFGSPLKNNPAFLR